MYRCFFGAAGAVYPCGRGHLYISHGNKHLHLSSTSTAATTPSYKEETLALSIINNNYVSASKGEYIICYQSPDSGYYPDRQATILYSNPSESPIRTTSTPVCAFTKKCNTRQHYLPWQRQHCRSGTGEHHVEHRQHLYNPPSSGGRCSGKLHFPILNHYTSPPQTKRSVGA